MGIPGIRKGVKIGCGRHIIEPACYTYFSSPIGIDVGYDRVFPVCPGNAGLGILIIGSVGTVNDVEEALIPVNDFCFAIAIKIK